MPLFLKKETADFSRIEIWKMEEEIEHLLAQSALSSAELMQVNSFQSTHRKREWLLTRIMLRQMMNSTSEKNGAIVYDKFGKPHLENSQTKISISHTKDFVGVMISETNHVGIDLERISPRIERIANKFLSEDERKRIPQVDMLHYYYVIWGSKEVLYKIHGKGEILFSKHLLTEPFMLAGKGTLRAWIKKKDFQQPFQIHYEFIGDLLLTYSISES